MISRETLEKWTQQEAAETIRRLEGEIIRKERALKIAHAEISILREQLTRLDPNIGESLTIQQRKTDATV